MKALIAVLLLFTVSSSPAITVISASGVAHERDKVKGKVIRVDQNSITEEIYDQLGNVAWKQVTQLI